MKLHLPNIIIAAAVVIVTWVSSNISWGKDHWRGILESDARGYYAYLPAAFIYGDLNFGFFDSIEKQKYYDPHFYYDYRVTVNGRTIDKYWCGTALCELPFFMAAQGLTKMGSGDADGYSKLYPVFINIAGIFYLLAGLLFLKKLLNRYKIAAGSQAIVITGIVFGTNLFYYSAVEPGMSHVYSFALIAAFLYNAKVLLETRCRKRIVLAGFLLGLIFLVRPQNVMILLALPFLAGSREAFFSSLSGLKEKTGPACYALGVFGALSSLQFIIYKVSCGSFFADSYPGEQFNFASPRMLDILFSYRKGLFLYTPLYLLCLGGLFVMFRRSRWEFLSFVLFFLVLTYVLSSWHNWWYGGSFSSRVYVEYLPLFALSFSFLLNSAKQAYRKMTLGLTVVLVLLCQAQTYQYRYDQIHWDGMTKEKYWKVFLRLDKLVS